MATLKDSDAIGLITIISSLLKYYCMLMPRPSGCRECRLGNSWHTLWSGTSLHTVYLERVEATLAKIDEIRGLIENNVAMDESEEEAPITLILNE